MNKTGILGNWRWRRLLKGGFFPGVAMLALIGVSPFGCGQVDSSTGGNTNWIHCTSSSECGALSCQCNVCSTPCGTQLDCTQAPEQMCAMQVAQGPSAGGSNNVGGVAGATALGGKVGAGASAGSSQPESGMGGRATLDACLAQAQTAQSAPISVATTSQRLAILFPEVPDRQELSSLLPTFNSPRQVQCLTEHFLRNPNAGVGIWSFYRTWLGANTLPPTKDATLFPEYNDALFLDMLTQSERLVTHHVLQSSGTLSELLTSTTTFVNAALAPLHALPPPQLPFTMVSAPERAGLLTQPLFATLYSTPKRTSPSARGRFLQERVLCNMVPMEPPEVQAARGSWDPAPGVPLRTALEAEMADPSCASCHQLMDRPGYALETFDAVGRARTVDQGLPIDSSGQILGLQVGGTFANTAELMRLLGGSVEAHYCHARHWLQYARLEPFRPNEPATMDAGADAAALASLQGNQLNLKALISNITATPGFLNP